MPKPLINLDLVWIKGPVFVIRPAPSRPLFAWKIGYSGEGYAGQAVFAAPADLLWAGADGQAWSYQRGYWRPMGAQKDGGVIVL